VKPVRAGSPIQPHPLGLYQWSLDRTKTLKQPLP